MGKKISGIPETLKAIGWIYLICGIIGAIVIWVTMGTISTGYYSSKANPVGIALGVVFLFQGVAVFVLFQAVGLISETVLELRNKFIEEPEGKAKSFEGLTKRQNKKKRDNINKKKKGMLEEIDKAIIKINKGYGAVYKGKSYSNKNIEKLHALRKEIFVSLV